MVHCVRRLNHIWSLSVHLHSMYFFTHALTAFGDDFCVRVHVSWARMVIALSDYALSHFRVVYVIASNRQLSWFHSSFRVIDSKVASDSWKWSPFVCPIDRLKKIAQNRKQFESSLIFDCILGLTHTDRHRARKRNIFLASFGFCYGTSFCEKSNHSDEHIDDAIMCD